MKMKWLEIIELRTSDRNLKELNKKILYLIDEVNKQKKDQVIKLYTHVNIENDFSIHIIHTAQPKKNGSDLGLFIAASLRAYGLINHNIWQKTIITTNGESS